jgi:shikimate dehydrogenase
LQVIKSPLADARGWFYFMLSISSHSRVLAIIGDPIEHSISPRIQNAAWQKANSDHALVACRVATDNLATAVRGARDLGFLGLMVTIPHKERVLDLCDELDQSARDVGAANLLHFRADGKTVGYSSDGWAAVKDLAEHGVSIRNRKIVILGAGGAARSLALTFAREGAQEIRVLNRTLERAQKIVNEVAALDVDCLASGIDTISMREHLHDADLLVNATSIGMSPHVDETPITPELLRPKLAVYDIVYNPLETRLLREARDIGATALDGLGMLIGTNIRAAQICANADLSWDVMREEALRALSEKRQ